MSDTQTNEPNRSGTDRADERQKSMKVKDRRMFTPDGELREEYRHLEESGESAGEPKASEASPEPVAEPPKAPEREPPSEPADPNAPSFFDLVSLLAENASVYLRHSAMPGAEGAQNQELAKLHIDLLAVLKQKTSGNLDREEQSMLDEMLYRLRLAFSSQRGF